MIIILILEETVIPEANDKIAVAIDKLNSQLQQLVNVFILLVK